MKKQMEGDDDRRRQEASDARKEGRSPSEEGVTTGASKQRRDLGKNATHEERLRGSGRGKQQPSQFSSEPKPGSTPSVRAGLNETQTDAFPPRREDDVAATGDLDGDDQRVLETLARLEGAESAPTVGEIAREADLPTDVAVPALRRLINDHDVVHELSADSGGGPRYRIKERT